MKLILCILTYFVLCLSVSKVHAQFTNSGNFKLAPTATITFFGDFINNGDFIDSSLTVAFAGLTSQKIGGSSLTQFKNLIINNSSGITLQQSLITYNNLTLTSGKVNLNGYSLTLGSEGNNGTLTGGGSGQYLLSGNAGSTFTRYCTNTAGAYFFPLGDAASYSPLSIDFADAGGLSSTSKINVSVTNAAHPQKGTAGSYISRYWTVTPTAIATNTIYSVDYTYAASDVTGVEANLFPFKYNNSGWLAAAGSGAQYTMGSGGVNPGNHTVNWNGLYTFSDFTAFGNGTPLPISLLNFDAYPEVNFVQTKWSTASETNNDYFTVERSSDALHFKPAGIVKGAGNSNEILDYSFTDTLPYKGISYYRLKQTDFDGAITCSTIRKVTFNTLENNAEMLSVYPNPSTLNGVYIKTGELIEDDKMDVKLLNLTGQLIYEKLVTPDLKGDLQFIDLGKIASGIYYLKITIGTMDSTFKLLLQHERN